MTDVTDYPVVLSALLFLLLSLAAWIGVTAGRARGFDGELADEQFGVVKTATLALLTLLIGFTFSMAMGRYDQRKNYEEEEANAIGTEYVRAALLPAGDAARVRALLLDYADQRVLFYTTRDDSALKQVNARVAALQAQLWSAVLGPAAAQPTPVTALVVSGMNDVLNAQGYAQAAWWNRIPTAAWWLMTAVGVGANLLVGFGASLVKRKFGLLLILPLVIATAFFFIADIDSPRRGVIRVAPMNLIDLAQSLRGP